MEQYLPEYQFFNRHNIIIQASVEETYSALWDLDLSQSSMVRLLFRFRGIPTHGVSLERLTEMGFISLGVRPCEEVLLGVVGKFWTLGGHLQKLDPSGFENFKQPGFAKAVWDFSLEDLGPRSTRLNTETRISCIDESAYQRFRPYWFFISPFSGWIRKISLELVKQRAEAKG